MLRLMLLVPLLTANASFKHIGGANGVEVYRQMSSPLIELFAEGDIEAPPAVVRDVLLDFDNASKVTENIGESRVLSRNDHEIIVYQRLKLPVVSDRDFTLRATWGVRGPLLLAHFAVDNSRGPKPQRGVVRVSIMQGTWELAPIRDGQATHARYHVQIDLAGSIPRWMVSSGSARSIPKLFQGLRRQARARAPGRPEASRETTVR